MNALVSYVAYLEKTMWPVGLSVRYPHPGASLPAWKVVTAAGILLAVTAVAIRWLRSRPYVAVGWLWYLGTLVPVIGLVQAGDQAMADRYSYIPLVGVFVAIAWGVRDASSAWPRGRPVIVWLAAAAVVMLTATAWSQTRYWRDSITLYEHSLSVVEGDPLLHYNLANELREQGRLDDAVRHYQDAIRFDPAYVAAHTNLGPILAQQGRTDEAIAHYATALRLKPDLAETHNNLGMLLGEQGKIADAIPHFEEAVRLKPELEGARQNLEVARKIVGVH
jgi:tetratricopeptide (TPR) repeat protein